MPLVYNRINKAGSTSMLRLLQQLAFQNKFILLSKGRPKVGCQLVLNNIFTFQVRIIERKKKLSNGVKARPEDLVVPEPFGQSFG